MYDDVVKSLAIKKYISLEDWFADVQKVLMYVNKEDVFYMKT